MEALPVALTPGEADTHQPVAHLPFLYPDQQQDDWQQKLSSCVATQEADLAAKTSRQANRREILDFWS